MSLVLVVEDVAHNYRLVEVNLRKIGFDVERASDFAGVREAVSSIKFYGRPVLFIVDLILRAVDSGLDICQYLRSHPDTSDIPIFVLTSRHDLEARVDACRIGVEAYLTKPYDPADLIAVVKKLTFRPEHDKDKPQGAD